MKAGEMKCPRCGRIIEDLDDVSLVSVKYYRAITIKTGSLAIKGHFTLEPQDGNIEPVEPLCPWCTLQLHLFMKGHGEIK
ncbi:MAG: hypothetical protein FWH25_05020 [Syntrophorhabdaceae bacterium]|nr:hypothetical protein [Syntrophorhabdaceae bacterium]